MELFDVGVVLMFYVGVGVGFGVGYSEIRVLIHGER